jgi:hypothetical protein
MDHHHKSLFAPGAALRDIRLQSLPGGPHLSGHETDFIECWAIFIHGHLQNDTLNDPWKMSMRRPAGSEKSGTTVLFHNRANCRDVRKDPQKNPLKSTLV